MRRSVSAFRAALGVGLLVGLLYWLMGVPTPAPPWWALCGLLGIFAGERGVTAVLDRLRRHVHRGRAAAGGAAGETEDRPPVQQASPR